MALTKQLLKKPKGVVFKIFGVTTSRQFTKTLEDYFVSQLPKYLKTHCKDEKLLNLLKVLRNESLEANKIKESVPKIETIGPNIESAINSIKLYVNYMTKNNIKNNSVDELKLFVWGEGYNNSAIRVPFYSDVPKALREWKTLQIKRYSFTSGSVEGQSAFFANSTLGNLTDCVDGYISAKKIEMNKKESKTYSKIAEIMSEEADNILFLTDNINEAKICLQSGMKSILVSRDDHNFTSEQTQEFIVIKRFDEIQFA